MMMENKAEKKKRMSPSERVDIVVDYLKNKNDWVNITMRNVEKIVSCSPAYFRRLIESLKRNNNIAYRMEIKRGSHKTHIFKYVETFNEKVSIWLKEKEFLFSEEEIYDIIKKLGNENFMTLYNTVLIINLCMIDTEKGIMDVDINKIHDALFLKEEEITTLVDNLIQVKILSFLSNSTTVVFSYRYNKYMNSGNFIQQVDGLEDTISTKGDKPDDVTINVECQSNKSDNANVHDDIDVLISEINLAKENFESNTQLLCSLLNNKMDKFIIERKKLIENHKDNMQSLLTKAMTENIELKDKIYSLEKEIEKLSDFKNKSLTYNDRLLSFLEQKLDVLIGSASEKIIEARQDVNLSQNPLKLNTLVSDLHRIIINLAEDIRNYRE